PLGEPPAPGPFRAFMDIAELAGLLHETAEHHDAFEKAAPKHDWWDWYAAYMHARQEGSTPDEASDAARRHMADVKPVLVSCPSRGDAPLCGRLRTGHAMVPAGRAGLRTAGAAGG